MPKRIYLVTATARHNEVGGESRFIHGRAFEDRQDAENFKPVFVALIENDKAGPITYCQAQALVQELLLIEKEEPANNQAPPQKRTDPVHYLTRDHDLGGTSACRKTSALLRFTSNVREVTCRDCRRELRNTVTKKAGSS